jgi:GNAT superfamily N-acetyltransferase
MSAEDTVIGPAEMGDADVLFELINAAYALEIGDTGLAFKRCNRYITVDQLTADLSRACADSADADTFLVARTAPAASGGGVLLGCVRGVHEVDPDGTRVCDVGPFAVSAAQQGGGVGTRLLGALERAAAARGCATMRLSVVNHRTDVQPFYERRGYATVRTSEFLQAMANFDVAALLTRPSHFLIMEKRL